MYYKIYILYEIDFFIKSDYNMKLGKIGVSEDLYESSGK